MIRILHSVSNMDRGGIETMLMNYYRHMDREAVQFDFLCNKKKPGDYDREIEEMGGRIFRTPGYKSYSRYMSFMAELFSAHPEYKIIHAHNGSFAVYALRGAKLNNIPVRIFHAHGAAITRDRLLPLKLVCKSGLKSNITDKWACGREAARCYFGGKTADSGEYRFVPNAIDIRKFRYNPAVREKTRRKYGLENRLVVGHVGRFTKQKNHKFLLKVFAEIKRREPSAALALLGYGELEEKTKALACELGISESVKFCGNVGNPEEWYQAFDVFVLPSIWEGLPVVGIEAQAAGLPCVFSENVTPEVGITSEAMFLSLKDTPAHWAERIIESGKARPRTDASDIIREAGYDITAEARKLQKIYTDIYSRFD